MIKKNIISKLVARDISKNQEPILPKMGIIKDFINKNKDQIMELFLLYQMIEMLFFMKLYLPIKDIKKINEKANSKTLGSLKNRYCKKFPNDECHLVDLLEITIKQRNFFMHSLWIQLSLMTDEQKIFKNGTAILKNLLENANQLFDEIVKCDLTFDKLRC